MIEICLLNNQNVTLLKDTLSLIKYLLDYCLAQLKDLQET